MPSRVVQLAPGRVPDPIARQVEALRRRLDLPDGFDPAILAEAEESARNPRLPALDRTDIEVVTIDPPGSRDLDQAVHVARAGTGYAVTYAIADVAAFVTPGGKLDAETCRRGQTYYAPHVRIPLHPPALSEQAASLLADGHPRPAVVWTIELDADGLVTGQDVRRAMVRSRAQLDYAGVQRDLDAGTASESLTLLREVGKLRQQVEIDRGGVSLDLPEQDVVADDGGWRLEFRSPLPVEGWNAQISLLTGGVAASMMLGAAVGIVRTLPPAQQAAVDTLRHVAKGLRIRWPGSLSYPEFVRSLDVSQPTHLAMMTACTSLFRGAGYEAFHGTVPEPTPVHAALAMPYAHVTAPLRRLVDRFGSEVCLATCAGTPVPQWTVEALDALPHLMGASDQKAKSYERGIVNLVEALVLSTRVGEVFGATVVSLTKDHTAIVQFADPAVEASIPADGLTLGAQIRVRLVTADPDGPVVTFEPV